jgi:AbrB family looped-hinge helix DNA binding protein
MAIVKASPKGQIVIPKELRRKLKIGPGKKLLIRAEGDHALIVPLPENPVDFFCGFFQERESLTKALLDERREEQNRESRDTLG